MRAIDLFDHGCRISSNGVCFRDGDSAYSFQEVADLTHRVANGLHAAGLRRGARVAIYSPNDVFAFAAMLGVFRAGCVWLPVPIRHVLAENLAFLVENECEFLFIHTSLAKDIPAIRRSVPGLRNVVMVDAPSAQVPSLCEWAGAFPASFPDDDHGPEDLAWIKTTGGTTGRPKNVMVCHRNVAAIVTTFHVCMPLAQPHINLMAVPMTHGAGNVALATLAMGGTVVNLRRAEPRAVIDAMERYRITTLFLPPTVIYSLLSEPDIRSRDFSSLRYFLYAAAPMSVNKLQEAIEVFGPVMAQCWGQTEASLILTYLAPHEHFEDGRISETRLKSCGRPTLTTRVEVMNDSGDLLPAGEIGELVVRGALVAKGYLNRPEEDAAMRQYGWHHTGDIGYRDSAGYVYIVDRKKDMIISGGFNIYPSEIEQVLWRHPAVIDCAVIGVPDDKWGESVKAIVELKSGHVATDTELQAYCRAELGAMKTPKSVEIWPTLPRSHVGKVLKREIRERFWHGFDRLI